MRSRIENILNRDSLTKFDLVTFSVIVAMVILEIVIGF